MLRTTIQRTGYAVLATIALSLSSTSLTTTAQAAPININPIAATEFLQEGNLVEVGFRSHHRGFRKFHRGSRSGFRGHRKFNRGHFSRGHKSFRSRKFSRHGSFRGHRFSRHGGFKYGGIRYR